MAKRSGSVDRTFQLAYWCAYRLLRLYWLVIPTKTRGALVAAWHHDRILLIRNSYRRCYSLPGGFIGRGETARQAGCRELTEEMDVTLSPDRLVPAADIVHRWERREDHVEVFEVQLESVPDIRIDHREVIAAEWFELDAALELDLLPPLRIYLEGCAQSDLATEDTEFTET